MRTLSPSSRPAVSPPPAPAHRRAALAGLLGAAVALGAAELLAGLFPTAIPSPVVSIGRWVIELTPGSAVRTGIDTLGRNDKPALLIGTVLVTLLAGAAMGGARRRNRALALGFGALAFTAIIAGLRQPDHQPVAVILAYALAAALGALSAAGLAAIGERPSPAPSDPVSPADPRQPPASRRSFLAYAGAGAAFAAAAATGGRALRGRSSAEAARQALVLPATTNSASPANTATAAPGAGGTSFSAVDGLSPFVTPNKDFYRIDTALIVPQVNPSTWRLRITGLVDREVTYTLDDLLARPLSEQQITMSCVSNEVGGDLVGNAAWRGIPLATLLAEAGVRPEATQIVGESVDRFTAGFPVQAALDGRPAMVVVGMNGEPLPLEHGFPARLVVAGLYGYVSATKWLTEIRLTRWEDENGFWIPRGWSREGPIKTQSRIDVPHSGATVAAGTVAVAGVAWAPTRGVTAVEVQVDGGPWEPAALSTVPGPETWAQWVYRWAATPGTHRISVRAADGTGAVQPAERREPAPNGATGHHQIRVEVR